MLASQDIPHEVARDADGLHLVVHPRDADRAAAALTAYAQENASASRPAPATVRRLSPSSAIGPVAAALGLLVFHLATGPWADGSRWFIVGAADAASIRHGAIWRTVTALTLHADLGHVLANAVAFALFGTALSSVLGVGAALLLVLLGGAVANALVAALRTSASVGVGASTAVFATVGLLAGAALGAPTPRQGSRRAAIASGLLLLAFLGMNEASDILAHVLGFAVGLPLGAAYARWANRTRSRAWQSALAAAAAAILLASWWRALSVGGP